MTTRQNLVDVAADIELIADGRFGGVAQVERMLGWAATLRHQSALLEAQEGVTDERSPDDGTSVIALMALMVGMFIGALLEVLHK